MCRKNPYGKMRVVIGKQPTKIKEVLHVHHIKPRSMGGTDDLSNLVVLCFDCHLKAHNYDFSNRHGLNEDMITKFNKIQNKRLQQNRSKTEIEDMIPIIEQLSARALAAQNNYKWKKTQKFYEGKYHAYQEMLELINEIKKNKELKCAEKVATKYTEV